MERHEHERIAHRSAEQSARHGHGDAHRREHQRDSEHENYRQKHHAAMASALAAEIRDRHADQRIDAWRQIQREAAKKYRQKAQQPSMIGKDVPDCGAGIIAAADTVPIRASRAYPVQRSPRRAPRCHCDRRADGRRPQAFDVVAALVVKSNRERVARLRREVLSCLERHFKFYIAPKHGDFVAAGGDIKRHRLCRRILDCTRRHAGRAADLELGRDVILTERLVRIDMPSRDHLGCDFQRAGAAGPKRRIDRGRGDLYEFIGLRGRGMRRGRENRQCECKKNRRCNQRPPQRASL